jgi:hypothetical protein
MTKYLTALLTTALALSTTTEIMAQPTYQLPAKSQQTNLFFYRMANKGEDGQSFTLDKVGSTKLGDILKSSSDTAADLNAFFSDYVASAQTEVQKANVKIKFAQGTPVHLQAFVLRSILDKKIQGSVAAPETTLFVSNKMLEELAFEYPHAASLGLFESAFLADKAGFNPNQVLHEGALTFHAIRESSAVGDENFTITTSEGARLQPRFGDDAIPQFITSLEMSSNRITRTMTITPFALTAEMIELQDLEVGIRAVQLSIPRGIMTGLSDNSSRQVQFYMDSLPLNYRAGDMVIVGSMDDAIEIQSKAQAITMILDQINQLGTHETCVF